MMRKCPFTGKIFDESRIEEYILHLLNTREEMRRKRAQKSLALTFHDWLHEEKLKLTHPSQVPDWLLENQQKIMDAINAGCRPKHHHWWDRDLFKPEDKFTKIVWTRECVFQDVLSNSHSCPDNGVENFMGDKDKPRGYPGWQTYIAGTLKRNKKNSGSYPYSSLLNMVGIKTGSGGGGNENWSYDAKVFLADWPGFQVEVDKIMEQRRIDGIEAERQRIIREENEIIRRLKGSRIVHTS